METAIPVACQGHIAKIKTDKEDQKIRVVVVKVEYKE